jgi:uncharacterized membrane protein
MIVMALDHVRDFIHAGAMTFSPEDLTRTTPILFFTRWITHICAPTFMFLAGVGAFLRLQRSGSKAEVSRFLWTRGLWLVFVELTVMRLAMNFTMSAQYPVILLVLTALGVSMIALAGLIYLPARALAVVSIGIIVLHNTLDGITARQWGAFAPLWNFLHQQGVFIAGGVPFLVAYPVLAWLGVMAAGFCFGPVLMLEPGERRRTTVALGATLVVLFFVVRAINMYGDPVRWSPQPSAVFTVLSFFRTTKYPPSLDFLLMTLGPALLALAYFDRHRPDSRNPVVVIGRVPFFYYVVHFWAAHAIASVLAYMRYGSASLTFLFMPLPSMGGPREVFPPGFGYPLWVAYVTWIALVVALYPLCRMMADFKARTRAWWTSYL